MKELSIFVDESGNFGMNAKHSPYYLVSFVFHDQQHDISEKVSHMERFLSELGFPNHCVHTEPIIRNEAVYKDLTLDERKKIFNCLCRFARRAPVSHKTFVFKKTEADSKFQMLSRMSREIAAFINSHLAFFKSFDSVKIYYDNGQAEITSLITTVMAPLIHDLTVKNITANNYRLFQVADLFCTLMLTQEKYMDKGKFSRSELCIFSNYHNFKKNYFSILSTKEMK
ncbi:MAG: DUF3800 domain-containing protein [Spirochaetales bacterium]|nr:DUF3800 domain-containing protein [Spirochaetales bacterium]